MGRRNSNSSISRRRREEEEEVNERLYIDVKEVRKIVGNKPQFRKVEPGWTLDPNYRWAKPIVKDLRNALEDTLDEGKEQEFHFLCELVVRYEDEQPEGRDRRQK